MKCQWNNCVCQVSSLSQRVAELEGQLDRAHRDKSSLTNQLEDTLHKLTSQEQDNAKVQCVYIVQDTSTSYTLVWTEQFKTT